jgi:radical SAM superfamily enzyme YgiQ (UPF0313 family)
MKILFIQPCPQLKGINGPPLPSFERLIIKIGMLIPRLSFPILAAITPEQHSVKMIDERYENIDFNCQYDLVGITAMINEISRAYELADELRRRGTKVVLGGPQVSALPTEAKEHADSVVIGEAEEIWPQLLHDLENGELKPFYQQLHPTNAQKIPSPKMSIISHYFIEGGVQTTRGCPNRCKFCYIGNSPEGRVFRKRPIEQVVQEVKNSRQKIIIFYDTSLTIDPRHTKSLFKALRGLNKNFICQGNVDVLRQDDELLSLSKEAGCIQWNIGFESVSPQSLEDANKRTNMVEGYHQAIEKIHNHKMNVHGYFIFGFDHDTKDIFDKTWDFIQQSKIDSAHFSILTPLPSTPLFEELQKQNRLLTTDWHQYGFHRTVVFKTKNISETDLLEGYKKLYQKYYSWHAIVNRFFNLIQRGISVSKIINFSIENIFTRPFYLKYMYEER